MMQIAVGHRSKKSGLHQVVEKHRDRKNKGKTCLFVYRPRAVGRDAPKPPAAAWCKYESGKGMCIRDWPEGSSHYSDGFWTTDAAVHATDVVRLWAIDGAARYEVRVCAAGQWIYHDSSTYDHGQMQTGDADSSAARVSLVAYAAASLTTSFGRSKSRAALVYLASLGAKPDPSWPIAALLK